MNRKKKREEDDGWGSGWFVQLLPTTQSRGPTHRVGASSFFSLAAPPPESFNTGRERSLKTKLENGSPKNPLLLYTPRHLFQNLRKRREAAVPE
jgi:hypothetical protein